VSDPGTLVAVLAAAVVALAMVSLAALKGWDGWLELRRLELSRERDREPKSPAAARLELADLKDRIRRLEAIANGEEEREPGRRRSG
jgi:hypothetical protein